MSDAFGVMLVVPEQTGRAMRAAYAEKLSGEEKQSMLEEFSSLRLDTDAPDKVREILEAIIRRGSRNKWFIMIMRNRRRSLSM